MSEYAGLLEDLALTAAFDPAKHPRNKPSGRDRVESPSDGGKFAKAEGSGVKPDPGFEEAIRREWDNPGVALQQAAARDGFESVEEWTAALDERLAEGIENTILTIRSPVELVDEITDDGRFQSQFESGVSGGALAPKLRTKAEQDMFGYAEDLDVAKRPIYGYLARPGKFADTVTQYGDVKWELRQSVRDRTTWTGGDSLGLGLLPSPVKQPSYLSLGRPSKLSPERQRELVSSKEPLDYTTHVKNPLAGAPSYVEAQIHGGVTLDDVVAVTLPGYYDFPPETIAALKKRGIKVETD